MTKSYHVVDCDGCDQTVVNLPNQKIIHEKNDHGGKEQTYRLPDFIKEAEALGGYIGLLRPLSLVDSQANTLFRAARIVFRTVNKCPLEVHECPHCDDLGELINLLIPFKEAEQ